MSRVRKLEVNHYDEAVKRWHFIDAKTAEEKKLKERRKDAYLHTKELEFKITGNKLVGLAKDWRGFAYISNSLEDAKRAVIIEYRKAYNESYW